jgi:hypothetical protein
MHEVFRSVAPEIQAEIGALISNLQALGWTVTDSRYEARSFGDWYVDLEGRSPAIRLVKDRSQCMVREVPIEILKMAGLWRVFNDVEEFKAAVFRWAETLNGEGDNTSGHN